MLKFNRQTNDETSQRFGKIKRAATQRTKPTLCSTFAFAQNIFLTEVPEIIINPEDKIKAEEELSIIISNKNEKE